MRAWIQEKAFIEWKNGVREMTFPVTEGNLDNAEQYFKKAIACKLTADLSPPGEGPLTSFTAAA